MSPSRRRFVRAAHAALPARNDVINHLATVDEMALHVQTMVPMQVLMDIDSSRNPMLLTKERLERAATENQFMNGKIHAIDVSTRCNSCEQLVITTVAAVPHASVVLSQVSG